MFQVGRGYLTPIQPKFAQRTVIDQRCLDAAGQLFDVLLQQRVIPTLEQYVLEQVKLKPDVLERLGEMTGSEQELWGRLRRVIGEALKDPSLQDLPAHYKEPMAHFLAREFTVPNMQRYTLQLPRGYRPTGALADKGNFVDDILRHAFDDEIFTYDLDVMTQKVLEIL